MLKPRNRHILITPDYVQSRQTRESIGILLPDDYEERQDKYCEASVLAVSPDVADNLKFSTAILVDRSMIEEIEYRGETVHMILENYVIASIEDE